MKGCVLMISLQSYVRRGHSALRRWALDPRLHTLARCFGYMLAGFFLSAASLGNHAIPLVLGLVCACSGWSALLVALGGCIGYRVFWSVTYTQPVVWLLLGAAVAVILADRRLTRQTPLLLPVIASFLVAASGLVFQVYFDDTTPVLIYLLRTLLGGATAWLFTRVLRERNPILDWLACAFGVLALAQVLPFAYLGFGYIAAGALAVAGSFPAAALAGLALDLAQITSVPMTAVMSLAYLPRLLPRSRPGLRKLIPCIMYFLVMWLTDSWDLHPFPALLVGGFLGAYLPAPGKATHRRGETGVAQVRLEVAAGVLAQTQQLLLEAPEAPMDQDALVARAAEQACNGCPCRKSCKDTAKLAQLPGTLLHKPLLTPDELPIHCRKSGRFLAQLHRSQEQLRSIRADRERQKEYRAAVVQQYQFLSDFLQDLSDQLSRRTDSTAALYTPKISIHANRPEADNGDRCIKFAGVLCNYYVLLCDGMGTGLGAVQEGRNAASLLRKLLCAGYPAEHALRSLNSLCALRSRAGAVTVDLLELHLQDGSATVYKWGAATSYLISAHAVEKLGCAGPPPGLSVTDCQESSHKLTLRRKETLLLVSDGIGQEEAYQCCLKGIGLSSGELVAQLLTCAQYGSQDDATVVAVRLENTTEQNISS